MAWGIGGCALQGGTETRDPAAREAAPAGQAAAGGTGTGAKPAGSPAVAAGSNPSSSASGPTKPAAGGALARSPEQPASGVAVAADPLAKSAQELLNVLGFGPLALDGIWGRQSRRALELFLGERNDSSPPSPTPKIVEMLREAARAAGLQGPGARRVP